MRFRTGTIRRLTALALAAALNGAPLSLAQTAKVAGAGTLTGRVFVSDGVTPRSDIVVKAAHLVTSHVFTSARTDRAGRYTFTELPSGQYQIAVQTPEGLYVNEDRIPVIPGRRTLFSLALNRPTVQEPPPAPPENPPPDNPPPENPPPENPPPENPPPEQLPSQEPPPQEQPAPPIEDQKPEEGKATEEKPKPKSAAEKDAAEKKKKTGAGFWRSGWGVAIGIGGGAVVLGLLADQIAGESSEPPSPSNSN